jgi:hypothetical protein
MLARSCSKTQIFLARPQARHSSTCFRGVHPKAAVCEITSLPKLQSQTIQSLGKAYSLVVRQFGSRVAANAE